MACSLPKAIRMAWQPYLASYTVFNQSKNEISTAKLDWKLIRNELPFLVKYEISQAEKYCIEAGGTPEMNQEFVRYLDFTEDGFLDYVIDGNETSCDSGSRYLDAGLGGNYYILFEGTANNGTKLLAHVPSIRIDINESKGKYPSLNFLVPGFSRNGSCTPDVQDYAPQRDYCWINWQLSNNYWKKMEELISK